MSVTQPSKKIIIITMQSKLIESINDGTNYLGEEGEHKIVTSRLVCYLLPLNIFNEKLHNFCLQLTY